MTLTPAVAAMVLLAALLHASWNALVKSSADRFLLLAAFNGFGIVGGGLLVPFVEPPGPASWWYLFLSILFHTGYYVFLLQAYRYGDLSRAYPLARGTAPLLVALGGALIAFEVPSGTALAGVLIACAGIISLTFERGIPGSSDARPVLYALGTSAWIAAYTLADGLGVRRSGSPLGYIAWLFLLDGIPIVVIAGVIRRGAIRRFAIRQWRIWVAGGTATLTAYGLVIFAMSKAPMGAVSALRETSVIMAAAIGTLLLGEPFGRMRIMAACLVAAGVSVIYVGR